jgi:hypothetical protein
MAAGTCPGGYGLRRAAWIQSVQAEAGGHPGLELFQLNSIIFSCSAGSFSAMTPPLPNRSQLENP